MRKTLVLVVDRDDDFGVKGKVNTPVIGVQNCLDAATAFGIADPEDSDLNALFAAVSTCLELQEDGHDADVALICGDEKVGHRSDLALVAQLEEVLDEVVPDSVVLVGDGAEDEYIYPIISSRAHVDSVRKVYVKQAPGLEGSLYILTRMIADPGKRKRFLAPLGIVLMLISLMFITPSLMLYFSDHNLTTLAGMSGSLTVFLIGFIILLYAYNIYDRLVGLNSYLKSNLIGHSTQFIFMCIGFMIIVICGIWVYYEVQDMYAVGGISKMLYLVSSMVWPVVLAVIVYVTGAMIEVYQTSKQIRLSHVFGCMSLASICLVAMGILDFLQSYVNADYATGIGALEIVAGVALSIFLNFFKTRVTKAKVPGVVYDEVQ